MVCYEQQGDRKTELRKIADTEKYDNGLLCLAMYVPRPGSSNILYVNICFFFFLQEKGSVCVGVGSLFTKLSIDVPPHSVLSLCRVSYQA